MAPAAVGDPITQQLYLTALWRDRKVQSLLCISETV